MSNKPKKLRRAVLKEELVALTGDPKSAMLLNQLIYWSERTADFDDFINEEIKRSVNEGIEINIEPTNGWFYKTVEDLKEELMNFLSRDKIMECLDTFINTGYLSRRKNPKYRWDRTNQYRVNISLIQRDLMRIGYALEGYRCEIPVEEIESINTMNVANTSKVVSGSPIVEKSTFHSRVFDFQKSENPPLKVENSTSNTIDYYIDYIHTTTTEQQKKIEKPEREEPKNVVVENEKGNKNTIPVVYQSDSAVIDEMVKQIQKTTGVEYIHLPGLESVLTMPDGIERLQRAVVNYPKFIERVTTVDNPVGFLSFIAQHDIKPPLFDKKTKKYNFNRFEQHSYNKEDLNRLFEPVT